MIITLDPYEIFLIGCAVSSYIFYDRMKLKVLCKKVDKALRAIGINPKDLE